MILIITYGISKDSFPSPIGSKGLTIDKNVCSIYNLSKRDSNEMVDGLVK